MELWQLRQRQSLPLEAKIVHSQQKIREWYEHWNGQVYVSFSGGKDSTVLLHLVRSIYPDVPAVFVDTGLEYPEIRRFVKQTENVVWLKPKMNFRQVIEKYGYPVVSKIISHQLSTLQNPSPKNEATRRLRLYGIRKDGTITKGKSVLPPKWRFLINAPFKISDRCCDVMKKEPLNRYVRETNRQPYVGMMASDCSQRERIYLQKGCNAFDSKNPKSNPLGFWTEKDIWDYLHEFNVPYSKIYDMGYTRTGCMFCMFGVHLEPEPNRFQRMKRTHPAQWRYCMTKLGLARVLDYIGVDYGKQLTLEELW